MYIIEVIAWSVFYFSSHTIMTVQADFYTAQGETIYLFQMFVLNFGFFWKQISGVT